MFDTAVTRLFPVETTDPAAEATALSVAVFTLALAALTLEIRLDKVVDRSSTGAGILGQVLAGSLLSGLGAYFSVRFLVRYFSKARSLAPSPSTA